MIDYLGANCATTIPYCTRHILSTKPYKVPHRSRIRIHIPLPFHAPAAPKGRVHPYGPTMNLLPVYSTTFPIETSNHHLNAPAPTSPARVHRIPGHVFAEQPYSLPQLGRNVLVGAGTRIDPSAEVVNCVIGRKCVIGAGARVYDSCLWNGVVVKEKCLVLGSLLADGVVVEAGGWGLGGVDGWVGVVGWKRVLENWGLRFRAGNVDCKRRQYRPEVGV